LGLLFAFTPVTVMSDATGDVEPPFKVMVVFIPAIFLREVGKSIYCPKKGL